MIHIQSVSDHSQLLQYITQSLRIEPDVKQQCFHSACSWPNFRAHMTAPYIENSPLTPADDAAVFLDFNVNCKIFRLNRRSNRSVSSKILHLKSICQNGSNF